jgi:hypothetical protein
MMICPEDGMRAPYSALIGVTAVLAASNASAQSEGPPPTTTPWRILLEQQLRQEKTCDLNEVILFDEYQKDGETVVEGKISCIDGRRFDFLRKRPHQKFEIDLCAPAVC